MLGGELLLQPGQVLIHQVDVHVLSGGVLVLLLFSIHGGLELGHAVCFYPVTLVSRLG